MDTHPRMYSPPHTPYLSPAGYHQSASAAVVGGHSSSGRETVQWGLSRHCLLQDPPSAVAVGTALSSYGHYRLEGFLLHPLKELLPEGVCESARG